MTDTDYKRVDTESVTPTPSGDAETPRTSSDTSAAGPLIRWIIIPLSMMLCLMQAFITTTAGNVYQQYLTSTLITVIGFGVMVLVILIANPLLRLMFRGLVRPLGRAELMSMIAALLITAGVPTFGMADQLVPLIPAPWNPQWDTPQRGWDQSIHPHLRHELYITDGETILQFREGIGQAPPEGADYSTRLGFYLEVWNEIPWGQWVGPLSLWLIFIFGCYGIFFALAYLVLDYWANREKLIFPLAKLHEAILPDEDGSSWIPSIFRSPLFWGGFLVSAGVLGYNALTLAELLPLTRIQLGMSSTQLTSVVSDTFFSGFGGGTDGLKFLIIFTAIGISFLLPLEISFSIWFYFILARTLILIMVRLGYGLDMRDFPSDWTWTQNPISTQATGAILLFSAVSLYRCIREYFRLAAGKSSGQKFKILMPVFCLAACILVVTLWIRWNHVPIIWALVFTIFITLLTLGIMRIVAESGVFYFQSHAGFFHVYKMLGLGKWMAPTLVAPLLPIYSVLFLDIKTFIAPNIVNAAKMNQDVGGGRFRFYLNLMVSLVATVIFSLVYAILLAYSRGANQMSGWFYTSGPRSFIENAAQATTRAPKFEPVTFAWFCLGAIWVGFSLFIRQRVFWFPHPAGYIMLINPLMNSLWFSFFIGWVCKKIVVKYGGKATFDKVRLFMLGLIIGELITIFITASTSLMTDASFPGLDLNRYGP